MAVGSLVTGIIISGMIYFVIFNRPVEKVEIIRNDLALIRKIMIIGILILGVGLIWIGKNI